MGKRAAVKTPQSGKKPRHDDATTEAANGLGLEASDAVYKVLEKFDEIGEDPNVTVEDVKDEIFDMVKPAEGGFITLRDLENCKVGDTVVGMLTDMHAFWQYDRLEQLMDHGVCV